MDTTIYKINDECRKNLNRYTIQAFSIIPEIDNPLILDAGCGTGVPALELLDHCNGIIYAIDTDREALNRLEGKLTGSGLTDRIKLIHGSIFNPSLFHEKFDIILAEGLLNVIGFKKGLTVLIKNLKDNGYLIIHDEIKNDNDKRTFFKKNNLILLYYFRLDKDVWWNEYYNCLEKKIKNINSNKLFEKEINEINAYKNNSQNFRSIFYVLQNNK